MVDALSETLICLVLLSAGMFSFLKMTSFLTALFLTKALNLFLSEVLLADTVWVVTLVLVATIAAAAPSSPELTAGEEPEALFEESLQEAEFS